MSHHTTQDPPTVKLFVRSLAPEGAEERQRAVIERLERLEADGRIGGFVVIIWGKKFCPATADRTEIGRLSRRFLSEFDEWSARTKLSVAPFFEVKNSYSAVTDESKTAIVYPLLALAEYDGTELVHVSPCRGSSENCSVEDHLNALAAGERQLPPEREQDTGQPSSLGAKLEAAQRKSEPWPNSLEQ